MNILNRIIKKMFANPIQEVVDMEPDLIELRYRLEEIQDTNSYNPLAAIVALFETISPWHDKDLVHNISILKDHARYSDLADHLQGLRSHFVDAGRDMRGMNRTRPGETITLDNIWLGGKFYLPTKRVSFWSGYKTNTDTVLVTTAGVHKTAYELISLDAQQFVASHVNGITLHVDYLLAVLPKKRVEKVA